MAEAAAQDFAPLALLALLKHPLVQSGEPRALWLDGVRALDRALRGPRPAPGLAGIDAHLPTATSANDDPRGGAPGLASDARNAGAFGGCFGDGEQPLAAMLATLRETAEALCGVAIWAGPAGRAAAELLADLELRATDGPALVDPASVAPLLRTLMEEVAVRPPQGGHPRLAIYGLIEARLQTADLMILGGLNEGTWPAIARARSVAGAAHAGRTGPARAGRGSASPRTISPARWARLVLITRARRDARAPAIASRFWLRLEAMAGGSLVRAPICRHGRRRSTIPACTSRRRDPRPSPRERPAAPDLGNRGRPAQGRSLRLLRAPDAAAGRSIRSTPIRARPGAAARSTRCSKPGSSEDECDPEALRPRAEALLAR